MTTVMLIGYLGGAVLLLNLAYQIVREMIKLPASKLAPQDRKNRRNLKKWLMVQPEPEYMPSIREQKVLDKIEELKDPNKYLPSHLITVRYILDEIKDILQ